ncbi:MAG: hypothetical protein M1831_003761 [Alyxoria varia]|nr:MAG: hypothetical protein M1831_003761 [Alyxoria varia]
MRPMLALFLFGLALPRNCAGVRSLTSDQSDACEKLAAQLGEKVSSIGQAGYNTSLESYWSNQEEKLQPACIVAPTSDEDVAQVIKIIAPHGRVGDIQFAVRGGGHTPFEGSANIDKGVTIDLSNLDDVNVSNDRETTTVGMGAKWGDIYQRLDEMGLAVAGGRVSSVGVGGLTLGGGLSFFSPRKGFVCDNVIDFEVVLASGRIIHANMRSHRALWVALRGGSNNFGVVTAMKLRTFEQGQIAGGYTYYDFSTTPQQLAAFSEFSSNPGYDEYASLIQTFSYAQSLNTSVVGNGLVYTKPQLDSPAFENFTSIPSLFSTLRITSLKSVTDELDDSSPPHF